MGLRLRHKSRKVITITTLVAIFALVAQPFYGLVSANIANAIAPMSTVLAPTGLNPANNSSTSNQSFDNTWSKVNGAVKYEYIATYMLNGLEQTYTDTSDAGNYDLNGSTIIRHNNGAPESTYTWQVRAIDTAGNKSTWSQVWNMIIDTIAPAKPTLSVTATNGGAPIADNSSTTTHNVTASWTQAAGASSYEYQYWNNIAGNAYNSETNAWKVNVGTATSQAGEFNQGVGTHYIRICALDPANNRTCSDTYTVTYYENVPTVLGENFNTHEDANYKGVNVGFSVKDVTGINVSLYDADGNLIVTNTAAADLFALIKSGTMQLSTPFVINPEGYTDQYWNFNTTGYAWAYNSPKPAKAVVVVTGTNEVGGLAQKDATITGLANEDAVAFESLLPSQQPETPTEEEPSGSGNTGNEIDGEDSEVATTTSTANTQGQFDEQLQRLTQPFTLPNSFIAAQNFATPEQDTGILGAETMKDLTTDQNAKTVAAAATQNGWKLFGLMWYWWVLQIAALVMITWWMITAAKRRAAEDM